MARFDRSDAPSPLRRRRGLAAALLVLPLLAGCKEDLYSGLSEREANEMAALLMRAGIDVDRVADDDAQNTVRVEASQLADAVEILSARGYPKREFATIGEVFQGNGFILSPTEERARLIYALSEELSQTVSDIDGVLTTRIHVVLPDADPLAREPTPSSASVFIRHDERAGLGDLLPQIKMLIANSIEGLTYENVSVVLVPVAVPQIAVPPQAPVEGAGIAANVRNSGIGLAALGALLAMVLFGRRAGAAARRSAGAPRE